jgi:hypothetical protein
MISVDKEETHFIPLSEWWAYWLSPKEETGEHAK